MPALRVAPIPKRKPREVVAVRLEEDVRRGLEAYAKTSGVNRSKACEHLLRWALSNVEHAPARRAR